MATNVHFLCLAYFFLKWELFQKILHVEKMKTFSFCSVTLKKKKNRTVYDTMWKNIVERGRPQMTIRRMRIACW
jgi:hypothetical protein